jgi:hypothetical protein
VVAGVVWYELRRRRSAALRARFGPEYDRVVHSTGAVKQAEASLEARARRVESLHIRPLSADDATRYGQTWRKVQERFVDDPRSAVSEADRLVGEVMHARGYPLGDFEQRVADISVDHAGVVMNYRAAREIAQAHARGEASTEDLRQAMVHYRALFDDLLETTPADVEARREHEREIARERR